MLRKDVAEAAGITDKMPFAERAKAMKGKTIAIQGVGSIVHAWQRLVAHRGGLDVEKDVRIAPMDPPAMLPALENKAIDGYATSMPFTTQAIVKGSAVMLASAASDAPDLVPFAYGLVYAKPETCRDKREMCARMARALAGAAKFIREKPDEALEMLRKRFDKLDRKCSKPRGRSRRRRMRRTRGSRSRAWRTRSRSASRPELLEPKDALKSFEGLYHGRVPALGPVDIKGIPADGAM